MTRASTRAPSVPLASPPPNKALPLTPLNPWHSLAAGACAPSLSVSAVRRSRAPNPLSGSDMGSKLVPDDSSRDQKPVAAVQQAVIGGAIGYLRLHPILRSIVGGAGAFPNAYAAKRQDGADSPNCC